MMKKLICIFSIIVMILACFIGCANNQTNDNVANQTEIDPSFESSEQLPESDTEQIYTPEIYKGTISDDYRFAFFYEDPNTEYGHRYWYVVQAGPDGLSPNPGGVQLIQKSTGINMTEGYYSETGFSTNWYNGSICKDDHMEHLTNSYIKTPGHDTMLLTIELCSKEAIDPMDVELLFEGFAFDMNYRYSEIEKTTLQLNAKIDDITLNQKLIHDSNLFEIDGYYYLLKANSVGSGGSDSKKYQHYTIEYISGTPETLYNSLNGNWRVIYDNSHYEDELYMREMVTPDGYHQYFKCDESGLKFGFELDDASQTFDENVRLDINSTWFCYIIDGVEHIIAH